MKVYIENLQPNMSPYNGKGKFVQRLAKALQKKGIEIVPTAKTCDINMRMNSLPSQPEGIKVVRLDTVAYSKEKLHRKIENNEVLKQAIIGADGVVYQSAVAQLMCEGVLKTKNHTNAIIANGVDPDEFKPKKVKLKGRVNFLIACQWMHDLRRVDKILKVWNDFSYDKSDVYLYINYHKDMTAEGLYLIFYHNVITGPVLLQEELNEDMAACDAVIQLTYQDACPNMAAEALACGTPIITSTTNGICEYIDSSHGEILDVDGEFTFNTVDWEFPPWQNEHLLLKCFQEFYSRRKQWVCTLPDSLNINNIADQYIQFFEKLLTKNN